MTPREALLAAIRDNLDDDLPRLAFADWLEENGEEDHAEFIRVECRLAGMSPDEEGRRALFLRDLELLAAHKDEWFGQVRHYCVFWECRRGFLDEVTTDAAPFLLHAEHLWNNHPLRFLRLTLTAADVAPLASSPYLAGVRRLDMSGNVLADGVASALARSPHLSRLERLQLPPGTLGPSGARALAMAPHLNSLTELHAAESALSADGLRALLESSRLPCLAVLNLNGRAGANNQPIPNVGAAGALELAHCPGSARLRKVLLHRNALNEQAVRALAESPYLDELELLGVDEPEGVSEEARAALRKRFGARWHPHAWLW